MGHGLMAGISTIPVVDAFLTMVNRDLPLDVIYKKINKKLIGLLPVERFTCLALFRLDTLNGTLSVLNAGMPDVLLLREAGEMRVFPSCNLPAGICTLGDPIVVQETQVARGDRLLAISDGMEELFSREELIRIFFEARKPLHAYQHPSCQDCRLRPTQDPAWKDYSCAFCFKILNAIGDVEQHDDVSWLYWEIPGFPYALDAPPRPVPAVDASLEPGLRFNLEIRPERSPVLDFVPQILRLLAGQGVARNELQTLALLLSETLTNALEHGLLGLDSSLKEEGFEAYESLRRERLAGLKGARINLGVQLWHACLDSHGIALIHVEVQDSGAGFDWQAWLDGQVGGGRIASGRGLLLVRAMAQGLTFNPAGNQVSFSLACG